MSKSNDLSGYVDVKAAVAASGYPRQTIYNASTIGFALNAANLLKYQLPACVRPASIRANQGALKLPEAKKWSPELCGT